MGEPGQHQFASYLVKEIEEKGVTIFQGVPSLLEMVLNEDGFNHCISLRCIFSGGEKLTNDLRDRLISSTKAKIYNLYGPTEASIDTTFFDIRKDITGSIIEAT